ncbi:MAG: tRNA pseudouridine(38-40) synthase TruA [Cryobacterium sp.]|nr:tRNA pseudouridine(38-40) synthase TruA [Oligoflexia bacterium]
MSSRAGVRKYAALISYVGTRYSGWQTQAHASGHDASIQETLEKTLERMIDQRVHWQASGRTDAGVHAMGQVANFSIDWHFGKRAGKPEITPYHLMRGLNTHLPPEIRVLDVRKAPPRFHAQIGALKKQYSYYIQTGRAPSALHAPFSRFHAGPFDIAAMNKSIQHLLGEHDYKPFQAAGSKVMKTTVRSILEADVKECGMGEVFPSPLDQLKMIRIRVVGTGFLRHMVRGIAGTLIQVGTGARLENIMGEILARQDRSLVGPTASPQGLWLERVWYPDLDFNQPAQEDFGPESEDDFTNPEHIEKNDLLSGE